MQFEPASKRVKFDSQGTVVSIRIPPRRNLLLILFLAFWLCAWTVGGFNIAPNVLSGNADSFFTFWLGGWAVAWLVVSSMLVWMITGYESLVLTNSSISHSYHVLGLRRTKHYDPASSDNLRWRGSTSSWGASGGWSYIFPSRALIMAYGGADVRLATDVDQTEADRIKDAVFKMTGVK
ncbi:MAG: hypothetical protein AAGG69_06035 [Pseudomonadota bacterium]